MRAALRHPAAWWAVLLAGLMPLAWLVAQTLQDQLGANPAEALIRATGDWTLRGLCVVLAVTPLRNLLGWPELASDGPFTVKVAVRLARSMSTVTCW